jgi:riboflavin biosynthesis pyrimidine reductase
LRDSLVDELSVVVQPTLAFGADYVPLFRPADGVPPAVRLSLREVERFDAGEVWLRYDVER